MKYKDMVQKMKSNLARIREIDEEAEITEELQTEQVSLVEANDSLKAKIEAEKSRMETDGFIAEAELNTPKEARIAPAAPIASAKPMVQDSIPATVKKWGGMLKSFKGENADYNAYKAGKWIMAIRGNDSAMKWCNEHGMPTTFIQDGQTEGSNTGGGYLVYDELDRTIIDLKLQYGVFRKNAKLTPMTSDVLNRPRRTGGLTAYFVGEGSAITKSTKAWDKVSLTAKKIGAIAKMSSELAEDAIISIADDLVDEIAYAFALKEDQCGFLGDGTSTYGGIVGANVALKDAAGTPTTTSAGGVIVGAGDLFSELTLIDHHKVIGKCPSYARLGAKWYCSPYYYDAVMATLATAAGGNTATDIVNGAVVNKFLGYPVELSEVFPSTDAVSQIVCLFGNMSKAAMFGDRRMTTIAFSEHAVVDSVSVFETDEVAVRGTERFDINVHDVGSTTVAGPIVGLQSLNA